MEEDEEFLHTFFSHVSGLCFDSAKEHVEKEKETCSGKNSPWATFLGLLQQLSLAEKSYIDIGFLQTKNKGFLRKDNSLKSVYDAMKNDFRKLEDQCRQCQDRRIVNYCQNIHQFLSARVNVSELYEKIYMMGVNKQIRYNEMLIQIESLIQKHILSFTDISLTPMKAVFSMETEILENLFRALIELQKLQFLPSLALIHGAHARLLAWENKIQDRESWKIGFLKNHPYPLLFQWLQKFKGAVLSKFSLYFHDTLAQQTTPNDMRQLCSKLQNDLYLKIVTFSKKHDVAYVIIMSDNQVNYDTTGYDSFPIIVSYPPKSPPQLELILRMITETSAELASLDRIIYKFSCQDVCTYILSKIEPNIYLVLVFDSKKSEKDKCITSFIADLSYNLRCTKAFTGLKDSIN